MKKLLVLSGFLDQKFPGNLKEAGQIVPDSVRILLCLQKETESGVVWLNLANFLLVSGVPVVKEPDSNGQKKVWLRLVRPGLVRAGFGVTSPLGVWYRLRKKQCLSYFTSILQLETLRF